MAFSSVIEEITTSLQKILDDLSASEIQFAVEPAKQGFGDISSNISFLLSKKLKKSPREISLLIAESYKPYLGGLVSGVEAHQSGYLNFTIDWEKVSRMIIQASVKEDYGEINLGNQIKIVVEHTSVNPNKALHIGHIRNIIIGDTLSRLLKKSNHDVRILNYIDDSGLQVADIIVGFRHLGFPIIPPEKKKFDHYCGDDVYVKTTEKYETDPSLQEIRKKVLQELEDGSSKTAKFADIITRQVLENQLETCWNLGVTYDCLNFESQILRSGLWKNIFEKLKDLGLIVFEQDGKNAGCWIIRGEENEEDKVIVRSNGTATYVAKDIPYAAWKLGLLEDPFNYKKHGHAQPDGRILWETTLETTAEPKQNFSGDKVITVIDSRQSRLQKIITSLMAKFKSVDDAYIHLGYESVTLSSDTAKSLGVDTQGKQAQMSGRKGVYVNADLVYSLLKTKTIEETKKRNPDLDDDTVDKIAHKVAVGTLRYEMIKQDLDKMITFDLIKSLSLEGDTAPYIQYTYARASRILEKSNYAPSLDAAYSLITSEYEKSLVKLIGLYDLQVRDASKNLSPKVIAKFCHDLAVAFNSFYEHVKVLDDENKDLENLRLCIVTSFKKTLANSLHLLGIHAPDRM